MAVVAHYGTFDVENFGDLLFPAILEYRLGERGRQFVHVSPIGGPPVWGDCVPTIGVDAFSDATPELAGVVVGGGHIVHASPTTLDRYDQGGLSAILAYPSLWLGAAYTAAQHDVPYCWNAPGVPQPFSPVGSRLVEWVAAMADYLAVRDRVSRARLIEAGVARLVRVAPDSALETPRLWSAEELDDAYSDAFVARGREVPERTVVMHLNQRYAGEEPGILAARLDRIAERMAATPILIAMGPCHGDDRLQREVGQLMAAEPLVIDRPRSLREVTSCLARAEAYLGSSLHGMVVACAFGTPGMVVVPRSAGTIGKFVGFLEQFQLTQWLSESWETSEERLDELITAPREQWRRVLEVASPLLDEHWRLLMKALSGKAGSEERGFVPLGKDEAIARLARLSGAVGAGATLYAPIVAEQAILANRYRREANEERREKESSVAERARLRAELETARATVTEALQSAEALKRSREAVLAEFTESKSQFQAEIVAAREAAAAEREQKESLLAGKASLLEEVEAKLGALEAERDAHDQANRQNERLLAEMAALRSEGEINQRGYDALRQDRERVGEEMATLQTTLEAERGAREQVRHENEQVRHENEQVRHENEQHLAEMAALRGEAEAQQRAYEALQQDHGRIQDEGDALRTELEAERGAREQARGESERLLGIQAKIASELDGLRAALNEEQAGAGQARAAAERFRGEAENERQEKQRARGERERLLRELTDMQTTLRDALVREQVGADVLYDVGRQLGAINALMVQVQDRIPGKGRSVNGKRELAVAKEALLGVREQLGKLRQATDQVELIPHPYDPNRILAGRRPGTSNGATDQSSAAAPQQATRILLAGTEAPARPGMADGAAGDKGPRADVIVCVHNALEDVERCLESVVRQTAERHHIIVVDDGSDAATAVYLERFRDEHPNVALLRNEQPMGYTKAANRGLQAATAGVMVLLNSDTIVTANWLESLMECITSDPKIGIAGPLSNAASYQSVPERFAGNGDWALNPAPPGWEIDDIAAAVAKISRRSFPRAPFVNGFCFAIRRAVVEAIGYFDEEGFPDGYGEENDYCLRAADAGFALAIADQAYVYHAKSRSYSHERRRELGKAGRGVLVRKHGIERLEAGEVWLRNEPTLETMREALGAYLQAVKPPHEAMRVLFLLPVSGGGGGAHSIVQEASGMRRMGIEAQVAIRAKHATRYRENYPAVGESERLFFAYRTLDELAAHAAQFAVVVATIHTSMPLLAAIAAEHPNVAPAYYIQDYEPFFYGEGTAEREEAARSYTLAPNVVHFAKTRWLCETVGALHEVTVHKVSPSLDHDVYFPPATKRDGEAARVIAMIRPSSARRGAGRTMEVLQRLARKCGEGVDVRIFGCTDADLAAAGLPRDFPFTNHGVLTREEVAERLRESDIFLDLSDYQAFGRTGLEAMACGCAVVVPALGGSDEYAVHGENALMVDTSQTELCYMAAEALVEHREARERLQAAGVATAAEYSIERAAQSELDLFANVVAERGSRREARSGALSPAWLTAAR